MAPMDRLHESNQWIACMDHIKCFLCCRVVVCILKMALSILTTAISTTMKPNGRVSLFLPLSMAPMDHISASPQMPSLMQGGGVCITDGTVTFNNCNIYDNEARYVSARFSCPDPLPPWTDLFVWCVQDVSLAPPFPCPELSSIAPMERLYRNATTLPCACRAR